MPATGALVVATLVSTALLYMKEKKVAMMPLISAALVAVFGLATLLADDPLFIKLKPTILYVLMGVILFVGVVVFKRGLLFYALSHAFELPEKAWQILSIRWAFFFFTMAAVNEVVWRHFSEDIWVDFKVFGFLPLVLLFAVMQTPFILKWQKQANEQ